MTVFPKTDSCDGKHQACALTDVFFFKRHSQAGLTPALGFGATSPRDDNSIVRQLLAFPGETRRSFHVGESALQRPEIPEIFGLQVFTLERARQIEKFKIVLYRVSEPAIIGVDAVFHRLLKKR